MELQRFVFQLQYLYIFSEYIFICRIHFNTTQILKHSFNLEQKFLILTFFVNFIFLKAEIKQLV